MRSEVNGKSVEINLSGHGWVCLSCGSATAKAVWNVDDGDHEKVVIRPVCDVCGCTDIIEITGPMMEAMVTRYIGNMINLNEGSDDEEEPKCDGNDCTRT